MSGIDERWNSLPDCIDSVADGAILKKVILTTEKISSKGFNAE